MVRSTSSEETRSEGAQESSSKDEDGTQRQPGSFDARRLGFRALLGWHYCVLFAPLFDLDWGAGFAQVLLARQFTMYLALACTFAVLFFAVRRGGKVKAALTSPPSIVAACVVGAVSTFASAPVLGWGAACLVSTLVLGACEAFLMAAWLLMLSVLAKRQSYRTLGADVVVGALVAMLVKSLLSPADVVVASLLPLLSSISFLTLRRVSNLRQDNPGADGASGTARDGGAGDAQPQGEALAAKARGSKTPGGYLVRRCAPAALFALAFGILQGSFLADGTALLVAFNPLLFTGAVVAGAIIFFTSERFCTHADADAMYRFSLVFFALGVILLIIMEVAGAQAGSQARAVCLCIADIAVFAGFNLFDFGNMMVCLATVRIYDSRYSHLIMAGRLVVYAFMALGVGAGFAAEMFVGAASSADVLAITCCTTLVLLVFTVVATASTQEGYVRLLAAAGRGDALHGALEFENVDPCEHCGSARDCTMRPMVERHAGGSLGVASPPNPGQATQVLHGPGRRSAGAGGARGGMAQGGDGAGQSAERDGGRDSARDAVKPGVRASGVSEAGRESAREDGGTAHGQALKSAGEEHRKLDHDAPAGQRRNAPWRAACDEIVSRYRLSRREAEIFSLISKGRNAEYVSTELVISIHTAKTHIANIYQKLGVHSSQEMLDLIDVFRAEIVDEDTAAD